MGRKACREQVKRDLKGLKSQRSVRADMARLFITSRCGRCMLCPKFMAKLDITPLPTTR